MDESDAQAVKVSLKNEMYPKFNFLRRRLFSVYPRFKVFVEKEELVDLIPDGKKLMSQIEAAQDKLKESLCLYIKGDHTSISTREIQTNFAVSLKGSDEFNIFKKPLGEAEFKENIKNIEGYPSVIVHVVKTEDDDAEMKLFEGDAQKLVVLIPPRARRSCVLCSKNCQKYGILDEINNTGSFSELGSMGKLIQSCLEDKVVKVLQQMVDFMELFLPAVQVNEKQEPLWVTMKNTLQTAIHDSNLNQEKHELGNRRDYEAGMAFYLCRNLETGICRNLSVTYGIRSCVVHEFLYKTKFDEKIQDKVGENPEIFKKSPIEIGQFYDNFSERVAEDLAKFEEQAKQKFTVVSSTLKKFLFEINGVFRQANIALGIAKPGSVPISIPKELKTKILSTEGVHGCGLIYDKLIVHVNDTVACDMNELPDKIRVIMRSLGRNDLVNNFEVQQVKFSTNAGVSYESGKSLRVGKAPSQEQVCVGDAIYADNYSYGTLGCFVNGKASIADTENSYMSQLYALTCAHVFPEGCDNCVEIGRTDLKYDTFGIVSPELTMLQEHIIDIAAVVVVDSVVAKCDTKLKNCDGFEAWDNILHEGDFSSLIGYEVYKWGSMSDLTHGTIVSVDYEVHGVDTLDKQYNILIEKLPTSETDFSTKGDSGTVVCFEVPEEEKVVALSMINGALQHEPSGNYLCSYSVHLQTNIEELSKKTNINFEWCE